MITKIMKQPVEIEQLKKHFSAQELRRICNRCGLPAHEWVNREIGYTRLDGGTYCCDGCAENTGCVCLDEAGLGL